METLDNIQIKKLEHANNVLPYYLTDYSSGMDLASANTEDIVLEPQNIKMIPTGLLIALPVGYEAQIRPRSGLAAKFGVTVLNAPGTIDSDYRGEINVILINHGHKPFIISRGMRIAQMVISKYVKINSWKSVDVLSDTIRGDNGFGSTGIN